jgi:hypothetical protein
MEQDTVVRESRKELDESPLGRNDDMKMPEQPEEAIRPRDPSVACCSYYLQIPSSLSSSLVIRGGSILDFLPRRRVHWHLVGQATLHSYILHNKGLALVCAR